MHSPRLRVAQHCAIAVFALLSVVASLPAFGVDTLYWTNLTSKNLSFFALDASNAGDIAVTGTTVNSPTGIALDPVARKVYWANSPNGISFAHLDGSGGGTLNVTGATVSSPKGVALDATAGRIYWANDNGKISYANLNGLGGGDLNTSGTSSGVPYGVALDQAAGRIYWANFSGNKISYANLNGSGGADLNTGAASISAPTGVAIDPVGNKIYWGNAGGGTAKISYASLSGSGGGDLTTAGSIDFPVGVAIDPALGRLFWANYGSSKISYANLDGSGGTDITIVGATVSGPGFLALLPYAISFDDPLCHNGFEACWSKAITKPDFLDTLQSTIDGVTSCIPQSSGVGYTACSQAKCPNNAIGCPVTTHAGPFSGAFVAGIGNKYTSTGSTSDIVIDIAYTGGGPCTITASNIALDYGLDYRLNVDGNSGLNVVSLDQSALTVHDGYMLTGSDPVCQTIAATGGATLVSEIETDGAAGIAALEAPATVGQSVCPLTP